MCFNPGSKFRVVPHLRRVLPRQTGVLLPPNQRLLVFYDGFLGFLTKVGTDHFLVSDNSSFVINLQQRRDSFFYLCGEVSRYIYKLCFRCYNSETIPLESSWFLLLGFQVREGTFMPVEEFLIRLQTTNKVTRACKLKAEGNHSGKKADKALVQKTALTMKTEFVRDGQAYLQYLIGEVFRQAWLSSNIVKGLAAFDPFIMLRRPTEVALRHFEVLYSTFLLRSWVTASNESACRDECVGLIDHLHNIYAPDFDVTQHFRDLIDFLMSLEYMQNHDHLMHLFKLCCLCSTSYSPDYPVVSMGTLSTTGFQSRSTDVILPAQSYLSGVSESLAYCVTDRKLNEFSLLSASFGRSAFFPEYDPWTYVDVLGRGKIFKSLVSTYRTAFSDSAEQMRGVDNPNVSIMGDTPAVQPPSDTKRRRKERSSSRSRASSVTKELATSSSNR